MDVWTVTYLLDAAASLGQGQRTTAEPAPDAADAAAAFRADDDGNDESEPLTKQDLAEHLNVAHASAVTRDQDSAATAEVAMDTRQDNHGASKEGAGVVAECSILAQSSDTVRSIDSDDRLSIGKQTNIVLGFVTSGMIRGLSGGAGPRALCSLSALKCLYSQQKTEKVIRHFHHGILVNVQNDGSSRCAKGALYSAYSKTWQHIL